MRMNWRKVGLWGVIFLILGLAVLGYGLSNQKKSFSNLFPSNGNDGTIDVLNNSASIVADATQAQKLIKLAHSNSQIELEIVEATQSGTEYDVYLPAAKGSGGLPAAGCVTKAGSNRNELKLYVDIQRLKSTQSDLGPERLLNNLLARCVAVSIAGDETELDSLVISFAKVIDEKVILGFKQ